MMALALFNYECKDDRDYDPYVKKMTEKLKKLNDIITKNDLKNHINELAQ